MIDINSKMLSKNLGSLFKLDNDGVGAIIDVLDVMDDTGLIRDTSGNLVILMSCTQNELYIIPQEILR